MKLNLSVTSLIKIRYPIWYKSISDSIIKHDFKRGSASSPRWSTGKNWPLDSPPLGAFIPVYLTEGIPAVSYTHLKRANAKRTSLPLYLHPSRLDSVREILARMHGLPALWLGDDNEGIGSYQSLTVWGWLEDWSATVIGPNEVSMNIDVQGLK